MITQKDRASDNAIPQGRTFRLDELAGIGSKSMLVPAGRQGVVISQNEPTRLLPPGRHRVCSFWQRIRGKGAGMLVGYVPSAAFQIPVYVEYLLSGDAELMDASLLLEVQVRDAARFLIEQVLPNPQDCRLSLTLDSEQARQLLGKIARRYAAVDLIHGLLDTSLSTELLAPLSQLLSDQGLHVSGVQSISFWRSAERAEVAEKVQALQERLLDVALQEQMAQIENQQQLKEFLQHYAPEIADHLGWQASAAAMQPKAAAPAALGERFRAWLQDFPIFKRSNARRQLAEAFNAPGSQPAAPASALAARPTQRWWLPRVVWIAFVLLAALVITGLVGWLAERAALDARLEIQLAVWGFAILAVLESLKTLIQQREQIAEQTFARHGYTYLDDLARHDRRRVDQLVRQQSNRQLCHVVEVLNEIRRQIYQAGDQQTALQLRALERKVEAAANQIMQPAFGSPPYLSDLRISRRTWQSMLDYDEDLLLFANSLADKAHYLQSMAVQEAQLASLERDLEHFVYLFRRRERAISLPDESLEVQARNR